MWNAPDLNNDYVMIADEQLDADENYKELIHHTLAPTALASESESEENTGKKHRKNINAPLIKLEDTIKG